MTRDDVGSSPAWLAELQQRFGVTVMTPLDRKTGTLRAVPANYDPQLREDIAPGQTLSSADRLAVYNRQYWFRLFGVLQSAYPLTTRLLGHWSFNDWATQFLSAHPPRGWDIDSVADGFDEFLGSIPSAQSFSLPNGASLPTEALLEGARIDAAYRRVFLAPDTTKKRRS
jgi:hypothetical protein